MVIQTRVLRLATRIRAALAAEPSPRFTRLIHVAVIMWVAAMAVKAYWNVQHDPPGTIRPCVFCQPISPVERQEPPPFRDQEPFPNQPPQPVQRAG